VGRKPSPPLPTSSFRHVESFLEMLAAERGAAANTIESYRRDLDDFADFAARRRVRPEDAPTRLVRDYLRRLSQAGMAASTSARRLSALRQFFRFLYAEGVRADDPCGTVESPRLRRPLPKHLNEDDVNRLLAAAHARPGPEGLRLAALLEVLYATGLRVSELVGLPLSALSRDAPMLIWTDPVRLPWSSEERTELAASAAHRRLLEEFPAGVHGRPEGGGDSPVVLLIWTYDMEAVEPTFPVALDPAYPEIVLRGMSRMIPALAGYLQRLPRCAVDGGYYTKTRENRFLAGPLPVEGAYVIGALSGYGLMAANGAADLLADHVTGRPLPAYAPAFRLERYDDPAYRARLEGWGDSGQL